VNLDKGKTNPSAYLSTMTKRYTNIFYTYLYFQVASTDIVSHEDTGEETKPTRIVVKLTADGNTIIVNEDGTETLTNTILQHPIQGAMHSVASNSDDITMAAVKSILQDAGNELG